MTPETLVEERIANVMSNWPTLDAAWGCEDCRALFRDPTQVGTCRHCGSASVFNVAVCLARSSESSSRSPEVEPVGVVDIDRLRPMLALLDAARRC